MAKQCSCGCGAPVFSKGLGMACWKRQYGKPIKKSTILLKRTPLPKSQKAIPKITAATAKRNKKYLEIRASWLPNHELCEARLLGCTVKSTQVHHKQGRQGELLFDTKKFLAVCSNCHDRIGSHHEEAIANGHSLNRVSKN